LLLLPEVEVDRVDGAVAVGVEDAALVDGAYRPERDERVVVVLCGANTDPASLGGHLVREKTPIVEGLTAPD